MLVTPNICEETEATNPGVVWQELGGQGSTFLLQFQRFNGTENRLRHTSSGSGTRSVLPVRSRREKLIAIGHTVNEPARLLSSNHKLMWTQHLLSNSRWRLIKRLLSNKWSDPRGWPKQRNHVANQYTLCRNQFLGLPPELLTIPPSCSGPKPPVDVVGQGRPR